MERTNGVCTRQRLSVALCMALGVSGVAMAAKPTTDAEREACRVAWQDEREVKLGLERFAAFGFDVPYPVTPERRASVKAFMSASAKPMGSAERFALDAACGFDG